MEVALPLFCHLEETKCSRDACVLRRCSDKQSGYNPITGQPYDGLPQAPELVRGVKAVPARVAEAEGAAERRLAGVEYRAQLRAQRIHNCGLDPAKVVNSVVDNFQPVL